MMAAIPAEIHAGFPGAGVIADDGVADKETLLRSHAQQLEGVIEDAASLALKSSSVSSTSKRTASYLYMGDLDWSNVSI